MAERAAESHEKESVQERVGDEPSFQSEWEALEALLRYGCSGKEIELIPDRLLKHFGSLKDSLEAPIPELMRIPGVSRNAAVLLSLIPQVSRWVQINHDIRNKVQGEKAVRAFVSKCFIGETVERFLLICLDKEKNLIHWQFVATGSVNASSVDLRKIINISLECNAKYAIIAHNHPRGQAFSSKDDLKTTQVIANSLNRMGVKLLDHIIVNSFDSFSVTEAPEKISYCLRV